MKKPLYLDYAATTPCDLSVIEVINQHLSFEGIFANPASRSHLYGWQAEASVEKARKQVANLIKAESREIIWTSGATESNNLAIKGFIEHGGESNCHIITSLTEHKAVIDTVSYLEKCGVNVTWLKPECDGSIKVESVEAAIQPNTKLISLMHVNNETGAISDIHSIAMLAQSKGIVFHVDAAQSAGKIHIDTQVTPVDLLSISAHKVYGPKGIGALFVRKKPGLKLKPLIHGGGHEQGMRSGTLPSQQIAGMGKAMEIAGTLLDDELNRISQLRDMFLKAALTNPLIKLNGGTQNAYPGIVNLSFKGLDGQVILSALPMLAISSGSACNSATISPSHVLTAMGITEQEALSSLRFSFGRYTTKDDITFAADNLLSVITKMTS